MNKSAVCTIITKSYLPYARTLASSLAEYNPDIECYVLLADRVDGYFDAVLEPFKFIYLENLSDREAIQKMCFYYTAFELCCALRGLLHEYMFEKTDAQKWIFLDSDILISNSLDVIFEQLDSSSILLTPHAITPLPNNYADPSELNFLRNGLYNAGFLGLRRTDIARKFISWFKDRLKSYSFNDYSREEFAMRGLFVDQLWLNLVPLYFDEVKFCLEPGANLGHWNLFDKSLNKDDCGNITVNDQPVLFTHFSGWDINNISKVSKYSSMYEHLETSPPWLELSSLYRDNLLKNGYEEFIDLPYSFNYFDDGELIPFEMRRQYYNHLAQEKALEIVPFDREIYVKFCQEDASHEEINQENINLDEVIPDEVIPDDISQDDRHPLKKVFIHITNIFKPRLKN